MARLTLGILGLLSVLCAHAARGDATPPLDSGKQSGAPSLDDREPPFAGQDGSWLNGSNRQPSSLLTMGPLTWTVYVDSYFAWQFHQPVDHTIFPTTVAPRHNEISVNLALLGIELTGLRGPIGRVYLQYGANTETVTGQDTSKTRGFYLTNRAFDYIQQVSAGWHFHVRHGLNLEIGIFSSYIAMESYLTQENWNYSHPFLSDFTPYYLSGVRLQLFPTQNSKLELWLVNGWQSFGQWHEARAGGHLFNVRPRESLSLTHVFYVGQDGVGDAQSLRVYTDNYAQWRFWKGQSPRAVRSAALALVADFGYEHRGDAPSGFMVGTSLSQRVEWTSWLATTVRGDLFYDQTGALLVQFPLASPYKLPTGEFLGGGVTLTLDALPSPWLLLRLEYAHREASRPYFSGPGGITGPEGVLLPPALQGTFTPDLRRSDDRLIGNLTLRL